MPLRNFKIIFKRIRNRRKASCFIFQKLTFLKSKKCYRVRSESLSYSRCRELIKEKIEVLGLNAKDYSTHSLRRGGATACALNNVPDRLFKKHGRWKSEYAKDGYVTESMEEKLEVSSKLGL